MAKVNASIPQGTRDFGPATVRKRNYIFQTIRNIFEQYGFQPLETPAMENLETLTGKYGDEGDKLIFKILNNGLGEPSKREQALQDFSSVLDGKNSKGITERALRYDLTIPFARYVAMNHSQLTFPFKRYQVQPVWRADKPQRGRYREFYQCDADVVGSDSLINDAEFACIYSDVFKKLNLPVTIRINSRKILTGLAEMCNASNFLTDITVAIDKIDKIGAEKVKAELASKGLDDSQVNIISDFLDINGSNEEKIAQLEKLFGENENGKKGISELSFMLGFPGVKNLSVDVTLARGLNYYTGIIYEVTATGVKMGSIGGGGRYDDLTGLFGVPGIPGVGISFGVDRIFDVMEELLLFPADIATGTKILFFNLGEKESRFAFEVMQQVREDGTACELYPANAKFDKQFKYAEKKEIPYVVIIGNEEMNSNTCKIKELKSGNQESVSITALIQKFKN